MPTNLQLYKKGRVHTLLLHCNGHGFGMVVYVILGDTDNRPNQMLRYEDVATTPPLWHICTCSNTWCRIEGFIQAQMKRSLSWSPCNITVYLSLSCTSGTSTAETPFMGSDKDELCYHQQLKCSLLFCQLPNLVQISSPVSQWYYKVSH